MKKILFILLALPFCINAQTISTIAGTTVAGYSGNGGPATAAKLKDPTGVSIDRLGNVYIADASNNVVRKINASGVITTIAGTGVAGYSGDGGPATLAKLKYPNHLAFDQIGNLYIADNSNDVVRKVDTFGIITTYAGTYMGSCCGDGGPATAAGINGIWGIAVDLPGNLYIVDGSNFLIRKVNLAGIISRFAGNGFMGSTGDGGPAINARLYPTGVCTDRFGNVYIADAGNNAVRKVNSSGIISRLAGNGTTAYLGDGIAAIASGLYSPYDVAADDSGNIFIADYNHHAVRKVDNAGIISTVAGIGTAGYSGDGGAPIAAEMNLPKGVTVKNNIVYVAEYGNHVIRSINLNPMSLESFLVTTNNNIIISPNPATDLLRISSQNIIKSITISNLMGQVVYQKYLDEKTLEIDIKHLPSNVYFVTINNTVIKRIVKVP